MFFVTFCELVNLQDSIRCKHILHKSMLLVILGKYIEIDLKIEKSNPRSFKNHFDLYTTI